MRTRAALVAAATLTGLLAAPTSAAGVAETCQGLPATIVVESNGRTSGTQGDDVIVGHDNVSIEARGGNDLICLDSGGVVDGDGDDSILVTGTDPNNRAAAWLGAGNDRYVGGPGPDQVVVPEEVVSPGSDNISTGAGRDTVFTPLDSATLDSAMPYHVVLDLGAGQDLMAVFALAPGSSVQVQAGNGSDHLEFWGDSADYFFDLGTGVVTRSGVETALLRGFEDYQLVLLKTSGLGVLGTPGRDKLTLAAGRLDLRLGDGRDSVVLGSFGRWTPAAGVIDLGADEDSLEAVARRVVGDLARGRLMLNNSGHPQGRLALLGVERLQADRAQVVVFRGGPEADWLSSGGCHIQMRGGPGPDHLAAFSYSSPRCSARVVGGAGRDHLLGGGADDRLIGGSGNDEARGRGGTDTCSAEREFSCEG